LVGDCARQQGGGLLSRSLRRSRKASPTSINEFQGIQFTLMEKSSFNYFDGTRVVHDLRSHRRLWCAVVMDEGDGDLIKLREIGNGAWFADTLYILSSGADDGALARLAAHWNPDARSWVSGSSAQKLLGEYGPGHPRILEVWWD
jgi:hypothetical protein